MATKICVVDSKNTSYIFHCSGEIVINKKFKGLGRLLTPIAEIGLRKPVFFILEGQKLKTDVLKACAIDD